MAFSAAQLQVPHTWACPIFLVIGAAFLVVGIIVRSWALAFICIWFLVLGLVPYGVPYLEGFQGRVAFSATARRWMAWLSFILFLAQQLGLDLLLNQGAIWSWAVIAFDILVAIGFVAVMKMALLPQAPEKPPPTAYKVGAMLMFLAYVLLMAGKAAALLAVDKLQMAKYPASNVNMVTLLVGLLTVVGVLTRLLLLPIQPRLNDFELFLVCFESLVFVVSAADGLSLYGEMYAHVEDGAARGGLAAVAGLCTSVAGLVYFLPVVLATELQHAVMQPEPNWLSRIHKQGTVAAVDCPLLVTRLVLWIVFKVPVSALFLKNLCAALLLRPFVDYLLFVVPGGPGHHGGDTGEALGGPRCREPPILYGIKAQTLQAQLDRRERQLRQHRKALLQYKQELDRMALEVERRDRLLAARREVQALGADLEDGRWEGGGSRHVDPPSHQRSTSPSSATLSMNQGLYSGGAEPLSEGNRPLPQQETLPQPSQSPTTPFSLPAPFAAPPPPPLPVPLPTAPIPKPQPAPMVSTAPLPKPRSSSPIPQLVPTSSPIAGPTAPALTAKCTFCQEQVPRSAFIDHFRQCNRAHREARAREDGGLLPSS